MSARPGGYSRGGGGGGGGSSHARKNPLANDRKKSRAVSMINPHSRQLYELMARQLYHDGYVAAAESVAQSARIAVPSIHRGGDQLSRLVTDGMVTSLLRARDVKEFALKHRVEHYLDASALYVPLATLKPGRMAMAQRFHTDDLGGKVRCVAMNRLGDLVACGGEGNVGARIFCRSAFEDEMLVAASAGIENTSAAVKTASTIAEARSFADHSQAVETVAFHPQGEPLLLSGGLDGHMFVFDFSSPAKNIVLRHEDTFPVRHAAWHPSGSHILIATDHNVPRLLSVADGRLLSPFETHSTHHKALSWCDFSPDGRTFAVSDMGGAFAVYDANSSKAVLTRSGAHSGVPVTSVCFSRSSRTVLTHGMDNVARLWDVRRVKDEVASFGTPKKLEFRPTAYFSASEAHVWAHDGSMGLVSCYDIYASMPVSSIKVENDGLRAFAVAPFDSAIATGGQDRKLHMWATSALTV